VRLCEYLNEIRIECKQNVVREIPELPEEVELRRMMQENHGPLIKKSNR
jgi:hypothetical protein